MPNMMSRISDCVSDATLTLRNKRKRQKTIIKVSYLRCEGNILSLVVVSNE